MLDLPPGKEEEEDLWEPHQYSSSMGTSWGYESNVLVGWGDGTVSLLIPVISKGESTPWILGSSSVLGMGSLQLQYILPAAAPPPHLSEESVC